MAFYIFQFLFLVIFSFITSYAKDKNLFLIAKTITFLILFIPAAVRYGIGTDYFNYAEIFDRLNHKGLSHTEMGWSWLNVFLGSNGFSYVSIFVVSSFLCYIFLMFTDKKDFFIVIITYYCHLYPPSYNIVRNCITISMAWYAYLCFLDNKKLKAYLILLLSTIFHSSGMVYILFFFLMDHIKCSKKVALLLAFISFIVLTRIDLQKFFLSLSLPKDFKYASYLLTSSRFFIKTNTNTGLGVMLTRFSILLLYLMSNEYKNEKERNYANWWFLALWVSTLLGQNIWILYRIATLFYLAHIVMMSHLNYKSKNGYVVMGNIFLFSYLILFVFFVFTLLKGFNEIVPYQTIWSAR